MSIFKSQPLRGTLYFVLLGLIWCRTAHAAVPVSAPAPASLLNRMTFDAAGERLSSLRIQIALKVTSSGHTRHVTVCGSFYHGEGYGQACSAPPTPAAAAVRQNWLNNLKKNIDSVWKSPADDGRILTQVDPPITLAHFESFFTWTEVPTGKRVGRDPEVRLSCQPRPNVKVRSTLDQVMRVLVGDFLVDARTGQILEANIVNTAPVDFGWGLVGRLYRVHYYTRLQETSDGLWYKAYVRQTLNYREFWSLKNSTEEIRITPDPPAAQPASGQRLARLRHGLRR